MMGQCQFIPWETSDLFMTVKAQMNFEASWGRGIVLRVQGEYCVRGRRMGWWHRNKRVYQPPLEGFHAGETCLLAQLVGLSTWAHCLGEKDFSLERTQQTERRDGKWFLPSRGSRVVIGRRGWPHCISVRHGFLIWKEGKINDNLSSRKERQ